jgi:hypothetical protein
MYSQFKLAGSSQPKGANLMSNSEYLPANVDGDVKNILAIMARCMANPILFDSGLNWYPNAHKDAVAVASEFDLDLWKVSQVLSVISPQRNWKVNVKDARVTIIAWRDGATEQERINILRQHRTAAPSGWSCFKRAWEILDGKRELVRKGAPKTWSFAMLIYQPERDDIVCVDSHAKRTEVGGEYEKRQGTLKFSEKQYNSAERNFILAGEMLGLTGAQVQAGAWEQRHDDLLEGSSIS